MSERRQAVVKNAGMDERRTYTIMHLNDRVASIHNDGSCVIYKKSFMPYNLYLDEDVQDLDTRLNNLANFNYWCASRVLSLDRKYAKEILNSLGMKQAVTDRDRAEIAISYHALSLTDVYWVKSYREKISFDEINLWEHSLADGFVDVCLRGKAFTVQNYELNSSSYAADVSALGVAPKAWIRRNDGFHLLKDGDELEVRNEILASRILDCFKLDHVEYSPAVYEYDGGSCNVSDSRIITSVDYSIVPYEYIVIYAENRDADAVELIKGIDSYSYYMMNIADYLVGNTDRHWGNWGGLVDNGTNKIIRLHALMDFNKAFNAYDTLDGAGCLTTSGKSMTQKDAAIEAVKAIWLNQIKDIDPALFFDQTSADMFYNRLNMLIAFDNKKD